MVQNDKFSGFGPGLGLPGSSPGTVYAGGSATFDETGYRRRRMIEMAKQRYIARYKQIQAQWPSMGEPQRLDARKILHYEYENLRRIYQSG